MACKEIAKHINRANEAIIFQASRQKNPSLKFIFFLDFKIIKKAIEGK